MKREEANDVVQYLIPSLRAVGIERRHCKIDTSTNSSGRLRGDIWISRSTKQNSKEFEKKIVSLVEAKHHKCEIGDIEWREAMSGGKSKAVNQGLPFYIVTNCIDSHRFYNADNDEEITVDGKVVTQLQPLEVLEKMCAQINIDNSHVIHKATKATAPIPRAKFRKSLHRLADIYRSCGLKEGDERIDPTVRFVVLKYIGDKEKLKRTLDKEVKLWDEYGGEKGNYKADFDQSYRDIFNGDYGNTYLDFKELVKLDSKVETKIKNDHYRQIHEEFTPYDFHGFNFDIFGAIYEEFATQTKKKEFGEFYTPRHITGLVSRLLLRNEITGRKLKICDPACGTGGFLTEAYKALKNNYTRHGKMNSRIQTSLETETFWGFDNDEKSVARTQINMFLVGDGHTHIKHIDDSLTGWEKKIDWGEEVFDYVVTNPPMGKYKGEAKINDFNWTSQKRCEMLFLERVVLATKLGGEIAIVVNDGMLESPSYENFRIHILDNCDIQAIVSLPRFLFAPYTKEKTYIIFLRRKQKGQLNQWQEYPIWHFIVDNDGYANSDKRYRTKWHDDLPELEEKFETALKLAQHFRSDKDYFETKSCDSERKVSHREAEEGLYGKKYGFIEMDEINENNFHNLLSEFHLRPIVNDEIPKEAFDKIYSEIVTLYKNNKDTGIVRSKCNSLLSKRITVGTSNKESIDSLFYCTGGNSGLTEDFIYANLPLRHEDAVEICTSSTQEETKMGFVSKNAILPNGKPLKVFGEECVLIARNGKAGTMEYIKEKRFATNDHAYVFTLKSAWKGKVNLQWFVNQYQHDFWNVSTSKSDNATFNKSWMKKMKVQIPDKPIQDEINKKILVIADMLKVLDTKGLNERIENIVNS